MELEWVLRDAWWPTAATVARLTGDLALAEDAVQEACAAALVQWPRDGVPVNPPGWITAVARRRAFDHVRRERARPAKERLAVQQYAAMEVDTISTVAADDQLALLFACCHPALEPTAQVCLTLRIVCGLPTASIARLLLLPQPTVAQRLVRAKRKFRDAGIRLHVPPPEEITRRLTPVLRTIYLTFTEGHAPHTGDAVVRSELCDESVRLARALSRLMPDEPEVTGLLALILLTSARNAARVDDDGAMVLLQDQDRTLWDRASVDEGLTLVESALALRRPGKYQLQAAIAACHADAATSDDTDWREIAALYSELLRFDPSPVIEANRTVAVAYAEGTAAGLAILDILTAGSQLARWPQLHIARGGLLTQAGCAEDAIGAYSEALALEPTGAVRRFLNEEITTLRAALLEGDEAGKANEIEDDYDDGVDAHP